MAAPPAALPPLAWLAAFRRALLLRRLILHLAAGVAAAGFASLGIVAASRLVPIARPLELACVLFLAFPLAALALSLARPLDERSAARIADRAFQGQGRLEALHCARSQPVDPAALAYVGEEASALLPPPARAAARFPFPAALARALLAAAALHALAPLLLPPPVTLPAEPVVELGEAHREALRKAAGEIRRVYLDRDGAERLAARLERLAEAERLTRRDFLKEASAARFERERLDAAQRAAASRRTPRQAGDLAEAVDAAGRMLDGTPSEAERALDLAAVEQMAKRNEAVEALGDLARALREGNTAEAELARARVEALLGRKVRMIDRAQFERLLSEGRVGADPTLGGTGEILLAPSSGAPGASGSPGNGQGGGEAAEGAGASRGDPSGGEAGPPGGAPGQGAPGAQGPAGAGPGQGPGAGAGAGDGADPDPVVRTGFDPAQAARDTRVKGSGPEGAGERAKIRGEGLPSLPGGPEQPVAARGGAPLTPAERSALREGEERFLKDYFETLEGGKDGERK